MLADSVDGAYRGAAFGWHRAMDTLGAATGPLIAILFLSHDPASLRPLYNWALLPGLCAVGILYFIREPVSSIAAKKPWINPLKSWNLFGLDFKRYLFSWGLFSIVNSSDVFLLMKAKSSGFSTTSIILMYCFYNLIYALSSPYLGRLSDRVKRRHVLIFGLLVFTAVYLGIGFATENWQYWVLFGTYGLYMGATDGVGKALALDLAPAEFKATAIGLLGTVTGLCTIVASLAAGLLWDHVDVQAPFFFAAAGAALASFSLSLQKES